VTAATDLLGVPELAPAIREALPRRRPPGLCLLASAAAGAVAFAVVVLVTLAGPRDGSEDTALRIAGWLLPWMLALPWLKHLDMRPVPWFFGCLFLGLFAAPVLACRVAYRATSLPYRDWAPEYWNAYRARVVRDERAIVLLALGAVEKPADPRWLRTLELVQRSLWIAVMVVMPVSMVLDSSIDRTVPDWLGLALFMVVIALMLSHAVVAVLLSERWTRRAA
jgi:hypothetical protein